MGGAKDRKNCWTGAEMLMFQYLDFATNRGYFLH
jgi:hypothetical protein